MLKKMLSRWDSRKLQAWGILFIASTVLCIWVFEDATFTNWFEAQKWFFLTYAGGNALEHGSGAIKEGIAAKNGGQE